MNPLISIIIPTYNRANFIGETLDSVLAQTYTNWECIVVDDGSTDNSLNIIQQYCDKDNRFEVFYRSNNRIKGASSCRNIGLENSKGEFIQFLDSDDCLAPNKLEIQLKKIYNEPAAIAICKWGVFSNDIDKTIIKRDLAYYKDFSSSRDLFDVLGIYNLYIPIHSFLVSRKLIKKSGKWNESLTINDDGEFFSRILLNTKEIKYCKNTMVYYRKNKGESLSSYSDKGKLRNLISSWKIIDKNLKPFFLKKKNLYVRHSKRRIFGQLKNKHPYFIFKNLLFFFDSIKNHSIKTIKKKLNIK